MKIVLVYSFCILILITSCFSGEKDTTIDFEKQRLELVRDKIEGEGIKDSLVLAAMRKVPRHEFVPEYLLDKAYIDSPLPIGEGQTISQPYIVGLMTELLDLDGDEKVLEIGTGSGYQAAILAEIVPEVYSIEIICTLATTAEMRLKTMGYDNVTVMCGDGYKGWEEHAPFDGIIVTCAPGHIPQPLVDQLAVGGKLVIPVGTYYQELLLITKDENGVHQERVIGVRFVPMTGEAQEKDTK
ncbi:protein-L-isoaspartate(D-aspartate) O-methyltransferase [bacterium]|nr:protein-L-isoaspartate(D-aspartate) O-methyltransferase [bacterium]